MFFNFYLTLGTYICKKFVGHVACIKSAGIKPADFANIKSDINLGRHSGLDFFYAIYITITIYIMQRGECCGLKWSDIDFKERSIHIQRNVVKLSGEINVLTDCETFMYGFKVGATIMLDVLTEGEMREI